MSRRLRRALTAFRRAAANRGGGLRGGVAVVVRAISVVRALGWRGLRDRLGDAARSLQPRTTTAAAPRPAPLPLEQVDLRVGVVLHLFHGDLLAEFRERLRNIPVPYSLLVSVPDQDGADRARAGFAGLPGMHALDVRIVANRGRDWAPLLVGFRDAVERLDLVCHLHSKKSLYTGRRRDDWRGYLLESLLGSRARIAWILGMFQADPRLGLVYPDTFEQMPPWAHAWLRNAETGAEFAGRLGFQIDPDAMFDYPVGSMFWIRVDALRPLLDLGLATEDFPAESGQTDGTLQHALERLVAPVTLQHGYRFGILPADGTLAMADDGERNWRQALPGTLEQRYRLAAAGMQRISVDLFDTLLLRPFLAHAGFLGYLEHLAARRWNVSGFAASRQRAEQSARLSEGRDPDLDAIYRALARLRPELPAARLQQMERDADSRLLQPRAALASLLAQETRAVSALSDTYYHAPELQAMLPPALRNRIGEIRASCDTGARKDSGEAWRRIADEPGVDPAHWLHLGDNACSDVQAPQDLGFRAPLHVLRPSSLLETVPALRPLHPGAAAGTRWQDSLWLGLVANRLSRLADESPACFDAGFVVPDAATLGYISLGPLVHDFVAWTAREALQAGHRDLLFLAREGWLLEQCFRRLAATTPSLDGLRGHYFLASRRATGLASLHAGDDLARLFAGTYTGPLAGLLRARLGEAAAAVAATQGLDRGMAYLPGMQAGIAQRLQPLLPALLALAEAERDAYRRYFTSIVGDSDAVPVAVDIGYSATIQSNLALLLERPLQGAYMALKASTATAPASSHARHFDGRRGDDPLASPILRNDLLLESLLTAPAAQFSHFSVGAVPQFVPGTEPPAPHLVEQVHAGALAFVDDLHRVAGEDALELEFDPRAVQVPLSCIGEGRWRLGTWSSALGVDDHYSGRGMVSPG
ncbi:MAG: polysaccharide biosynthesis protein [Pseudomonadota bacterium]|nr:polysaccharide biosynthesis protein [Pseudomonadota bacterium]